MKDSISLVNINGRAAAIVDTKNMMKVSISDLDSNLCNFIILYQCLQYRNILVIDKIQKL